MLLARHFQDRRCQDAKPALDVRQAGLQGVHEALTGKTVVDMGEGIGHQSILG